MSHCTLYPSHHLAIAEFDGKQQNTKVRTENRSSDMSADYWVSSQRAHWQFTKDHLTHLRFSMMYWEKQKVTNSAFLLRFDTNMRIFIHQMIARLGRRLSLRQIILSTAEVYISRFLTKVSLIEVNVYMLITTCVYIACKICESPQHIRTVLSEARNCWPEFISGDFTKLAEFEFYIIEELECYLIIHHPYNSLVQLVKVLGRASGVNAKSTDGEGSENNNGNNDTMERNIKYRVNLTDSEIESVWQVINDSYMTDLPLLYPPHIIAIAALHLVLTLSVDNSNIPEGPGGSDALNSKKGVKGHNGSNTSSGGGSTGSSSGNVDPLLSFILDGNGKASSAGNESGMKETGGGNNAEDLLNGSNGNSRRSGGNGGSTGLRRKLSQSLTHPGRNKAGSVSPEKSGYSNSNSNNNNNRNNARLEAFTNFLAGSNVNLGEVVESVQELLTLYEAWQLYDEGTLRGTVKSVLMALHNRGGNLNALSGNTGGSVVSTASGGTAGGK